MNRKTLAYLVIVLLLAVTWQAPYLDAAVSRLKTWGAGETLTASDLNAEFNNVLNNGEDLGWPATKAKDMDGNQILLDGDQDTHITSDSDDRIDFAVGGFDGLRIDGTTASSVNGFDLQTQSTGVAPQIEARGESNIGIEIQDSNGNEMLVLGSTASAVNEITIANTATGVAPVVRSSGEANIGWELQDSNSNEVIIGASTASAVNEVTVTNAATGNDPAISATGEDSNVSLELTPQGTGSVTIGGTFFLRGYIAGLVLSNNGTDADHDIDIASGVAADDTTYFPMEISSSITKRIDAAWAVGTNQGCLDGTESVGGTPDANTWYFYYVIRRSDTGVEDVLCSESASSPMLPTNYDQKRLAGMGLTNGSANIIAFSAIETAGGGLYYLWDDPPLDVDLSNTLTTSERSDALSVPVGLNVWAIINAFANDGSSGYAVYIHSPDTNDEAPSASAAPLATLEAPSGENASAQLRIMTDTSAQIASRANLATVDAYRVSTLGFEWSRR